MPTAKGPAELLHQALLAAYPERNDLDDLTQFDFDTPLNQISPPTDKIGMAIKEVTRWAAKKGRLVDLVVAAKAREPGNQLLSEFNVTTLQLEDNPGDVIGAGSGTDFDARLSAAVDKLASGNETNQVSAIVALQGLAGSGRRSEQLALYRTTVANLRVKYPKNVERDLVNLFQATVAAAFGASVDRPADVGVDYNRVSLPRVKIPDRDLSEADIAFADLSRANLTGCNMWRVRGYGVDLTKARLSRTSLEEARLRNAVAPGAHFHESRMIAMRLEEAELASAEFQRALMQGARLDGSDLTGAKFEGANLADTDLRGAVIDTAAAKSIARATNWRKAKLDGAAKTLVEEHAD